MDLEPQHIDANTRLIIFNVWLACFVVMSVSDNYSFIPFTPLALTIWWGWKIFTELKDRKRHIANLK